MATTFIQQGTENSGALFSPCTRYRYQLWRRWQETPGPSVLWIMLNPSTADAEHTDPTIRRCMQFSQDWQYARMDVVNLFAWRATKPADLKQAKKPVGPKNDKLVVDLAKSADRVVLAWGVHGSLLDRNHKMIRRLVKQDIELYCLGISKEGHPRHPLYMRADTQARLYQC